MQDEDSKFEIMLPDGKVFIPEKEQEVQDFEKDEKPKKTRFSLKSGCDRCGECCRRSTPIILKEDIPLFNKGVLSEKDIYTIREGEKVFSSIDGEIYDSSMEIIKIRPIFGSSTCLFYDPEFGCTIYENRPTVCREYECWSQNMAITGLEKRRLTRSDLFSSIEIINEAINKQEEKCSLSKFSDIVDKFISGKNENFEKIVEMIIYDMAIRDWVKEKLEIQDDLLPLLFGKPILELAPLHGLIIEKEGENFIIKVMEEKK